MSQHRAMAVVPSTHPTIQDIRAQFPALRDDFAFMENAGGSQMPGVVADAIRDYMLNSYVQLGAGYAISNAATKVVDDAHEFINRVMGGEGIGQVMLGPSSTQLVTMLAECYSRKLQPGDRVVVAETGHEANIGPWMKLERFGIEIETWEMHPKTLQCPMESLEALLSDGKTRVVTFPHVSNLLGEVVDAAAITAMAHRYGARVVVDGVAYAPHRGIDVAAWDVDWYFYSTYKVYGPHMAALYGRQDAIDELSGPNHFFVAKEQVPYKFELGGANHEGCAGLLALGKYLNFLVGASGRTTRTTVVDAFSLMAELELAIQNPLIDFLSSKQGVHIIGPKSSGLERVSIVSFVKQGSKSMDLAKAINSTGKIGVRAGHMYAYRMCERIGIPSDDGVVRIGLVHYNTLEEIQGLIRTLEPLL